MRPSDNSAASAHVDEQRARGPHQRRGEVPLPSRDGDVQFLIRSDGDLALIEYCRRLAGQPDSVIADDVDAHGWVLLI
jgi:hypothetical protein